MSFRLALTDDEIRFRLNHLLTPRDLADLLDVSFSDLTYYLYRMPDEEKYETFEIPKKMGGVRVIHSPTNSIKILQRKLLQILTAIYQPKKCVHGFVTQRSIKTNAQKHKRQRYVLNVDISDFFPSINFGRVRGMFMAFPYNLRPQVATVMAQICCFQNQLPQGAPTSPIVSNMVCYRLDNQLQKLARDNRCFYTRYADDITISTSLRNFPVDIAYVRGGKTVVGLTLENIITSNGFAINPKKVRLQHSYHRQDVTGLTVNEFPNVKRNYVRQIRAMLHDWEHNGLQQAKRIHEAVYSSKHRNPVTEHPQFHKVIEGKLAYLKMARKRTETEDVIHSKLRAKYRRLLHRDGVLEDLQAYIPPETGKVFISHSSVDKTFAIKIAETLYGYEEQIWIDTDEIKSGVEWSNAIEEGLSQCDIMILIHSPDSVVSENVKDEWMHFIDTGKKSSILPIMYRKVDPVEISFQIRRIQWIDFTNQYRFDDNVKKLRAELIRMRERNTQNT